VKKITLQDFDKRLMDGFVFCRKAFSFLEQEHKDSGGTGRLRLRSDRAAKKLLEELLPITHYIRSIYREGRNVRVRWIDGNQSYDAVILSSGIIVENSPIKKRQYVEVTTAIHESEHLQRRILHEQGVVFGVRGISHDKKTRKLTSVPVAVDGEEHLDWLVSKVRKVIAKKCGIKYPKGTVLIVRCHPESLLYEHEWRSVVDRLRDPEIEYPFSEVFLCENRFSGSIYAPTA
jgi:hypothetical protein